jgi:hypothetical protein
LRFLEPTPSPTYLTGDRYLPWHSFPIHTRRTTTGVVYNLGIVVFVPSIHWCVCVCREREFERECVIDSRSFLIFKFRESRIDFILCVYVSVGMVAPLLLLEYVSLSVLLFVCQSFFLVAVVVGWKVLRFLQTFQQVTSRCGSCSF